jgi:hypothetical protein
MGQEWRKPEEIVPKGAPMCHGQARLRIRARARLTRAWQQHKK